MIDQINQALLLLLKEKAYIGIREGKVALLFDANRYLDSAFNRASSFPLARDLEVRASVAAARWKNSLELLKLGSICLERLEISKDSQSGEKDSRRGRDGGES